MTEKTIQRECAHCGNEFLVVPSRLRHGRGLHCSPACQYAARRARPKNVIQFECIGCGSSFTRSPSVARSHKGAGKYCTRACRDLHWLGPLNPNWQNGDKVYKRGSHWFSIRRKILARDGNKCVDCGSPDALHVHHIIPFRMFADKIAANADDNLITLCAPCHRREDAKHKWVALPSGVLRFASGGVAWKLARDKGMV